jgi:two-component system response regulator GlrR
MNEMMSEQTSGRRSPRILLVDDDTDILELLSVWLKGAGYTVTTAENGQQALAQVEAVRPDLVVTDVLMEGIDGLKLLSELRRQNPVLPVIMLSGSAGIPDAVTATKLGASAFLTKPITKETLLEQLEQVHTAWVTWQNSEHPEFGREIIGRSSAMRELLELAGLVATAGDSTVLITGETGTGKEVLARAIHEGSLRRKKRFLAVNCGALPESLLGSELFGHEKGAFTGATTRYPGIFQAANEGTVFLDEIGDMPSHLQVGLLRVLQESEVRPLGSTKNIPVDVRILSATHQNLEEAVKRGEFREDLYYRLNVVPLHVPSLAERREDIPQLVEHRLEELAEKQGIRKCFAPDAMEYMVEAPWPGNIRQLFNIVEQCTVLSITEIIPLSLVQRALKNRVDDIPTLEEARQAFEREYLIRVLKVANGNITNAARIAGRNRTEFYKLLHRHTLDPAMFRQVP